MATSKQCLPKILIVDDLLENLLVMKKILAELEAELFCADSGNAALALTLEHQFALCLLDVMMPDMNGIETAELMRQNEATEGMPIIFVTAMAESDQYIFKGYQSGAVDYLYKPIVQEILLAKVQVFLELECRYQELREANKIIIEQNALLESRANRDGLTGLYNHAYFQELFIHEFDLAKRHYTPLTIMMCDLDYFKNVNDTYGHQAGDIALQEFADLLTSQIRDTDILARYGGEEFILLLPNTDLRGGGRVAEKIRVQAENHHYHHGTTNFQTTVSIGITTLQHDLEQPQMLIQQADSALYKAKANGRNRVVMYQVMEEIYPEAKTDEYNFGQMQKQLKDALEKNKAAALASFEALAYNRLTEHDSIRKRNEKAVTLVNMISSRMNLPEELRQTFRRSFKLHDLFRAYVGDSALDKDGSLSLVEQQAILQQPMQLKELTDLFDFFANERQVLLCHHEYYDGNGYPEGLEGDEIPLAARIFSLVDSIIAMTMPTYPRVPLTGEQLINEMKEKAGKQFDPLLVDLVIQLFEEKGVSW